MDLSSPPFTSPVEDDDGEWILTSYLAAAQKFDVVHFLRVRAILIGQPKEATHSQVLSQPAQYALA
jgi:hypothetical protein